MRAHGLIFSLLFGVLFSATAFAQTKQDTNREVIRTYARIYYEQKNYAAVEAKVQSYLPQDAQDAILWNYLGLAQMELGKFPQACQSLEKSKALVEAGDNQVQIVFNLADCYNRSRNHRNSMASLNELVAMQNDYSFSASRIIELMQRGAIRPGHSLPKLSRAEEKSRFLLSGAVAVGFDTNVLLLEETVMNTIPVGDRGSFFITPAVQLGYEGKLFDHRFEARYIAAFTEYLTSSVQSFNNLFQRADFRIGSGPIQWGLFTDVLFMNRNPFQLYSYNIGGSWNHRRAIDSTHSWTFEVPVRYQNFRLDGMSNVENDRTGIQMEARAVYRALRGDGIGMFTGQLGIENQYTWGENYRLTGLNLPFSYMLSLPLFKSLNLINTFSGELGADWYWQSEFDRRDLNVRLGAGLVRRFLGGWSVNLDYSYFKNFSSAPLARYSKNLYSVLMSHDF